MLFFNRLPDGEEPQTITSLYLGQGRGKIKTSYYGEAHRQCQKKRTWIC
jgi:hypothetical protein